MARCGSGHLLLWRYYSELFDVGPCRPALNSGTGATPKSVPAESISLNNGQKRPTACRLSVFHIQPSPWVSPRLRGFSSGADASCRMGQEPGPRQWDDSAKNGDAGGGRLPASWPPADGDGSDRMRTDGKQEDQGLRAKATISSDRHRLSGLVQTNAQRPTY